jgi:hypothetical protein
LTVEDQAVLDAADALCDDWTGDMEDALISAVMDRRAAMRPPP